MCKSLQIPSPTISWSVFLMEKMFVGLSCSWKMFKLITNRIKQTYPKEKSRTISKNPGIKIWGKSRPGKSRDPGILQKSRPVPSRPGMKFLGTLDTEAGTSVLFWAQSRNSKKPCLGTHSCPLWKGMLEYNNSKDAQLWQWLWKSTDKEIKYEKKLISLVHC